MTNNPRFDFAALPLAAGPPGVYTSDGLEQEQRMLNKINEILHDGEWELSSQDRDELVHYLTSELKIAREAQFQLDCEADCWYCGNQGYQPAVWDEEANGYFHLPLKGGRKEWCDATLLRMFWAEAHKA